MSKKTDLSLRLKNAAANASALAEESRNSAESANLAKQKLDGVRRTVERTQKALETVREKVSDPKTGDHSHKSFPIVGIGASAGGLEAAAQLLEHLRSDTNMAFVLVQHLDPTHESLLTQLLSRSTKMPVREAKNNLQLEPNCIYVIPPNKIMGLSRKRLKLYPRVDGKFARMPVDYFLRSLAQEEGEYTVGVILSGTGSDGNQGLLAIKAAGGVTFAQDEKSAKYALMPRNAVAAGCVDFILPPAKMADELARISGFLNTAPAINAEEKIRPSGNENHFNEILRLLNQRASVDFTHYKHATIWRRLHRRMTLHKLSSIKDYLAYMHSQPSEATELFNDILIHVTGFFRDPAVFKTLGKKIFPRLLRAKSGEDGVRIWVPGCSTGEEVYSLAISLLEVMNEKKLQRPVQIFGTDVDDSILDKARAGIYPESIQSVISTELLRHCFTRTDGGFRVNKTVREMCIFARQNLAKDPPFSNLDFISCRNVLIYLGPALQRSVMPIFHYALRPTGLLMVGASETVGSLSDLFVLKDNKARIYCKNAVQTPAVKFTAAVPQIRNKSENVVSVPTAPAIPDLQKQADRILLAGFGPAGVIINKNLKVLHFRGHTGPFLEHPHGEASFDLIKMAREGLALDLRATVSKAIKRNIRTKREHAQVKQSRHWLECSIEVIPFNAPPSQERFYIVLFEGVALSDRVAIKSKNSPGKKTRSRRAEEQELEYLRDELAASRESQQSVVEEQEATNEELRSANEEIMSSNEELQSTNEELETAKEELQSTNEELTTLNDELEGRNAELSEVNGDLQNLLSSVNIPVIILTSDLRIRRYTIMAEKMFKLIPGDIGRPITDINTPLDMPDLNSQIQEVLDSLAPKDLELCDKHGRWWSVRIRAYKTLEHKIDGVVIALMDIHLLKTLMDEIGRNRDFAEAIVNTVREPLLVLDDKLNVKSANQRFYKTFKVKPEETTGRRIYDLGNGQWDIPKLRVLLDEILKHNTYFDDYEVEHDFPNIGKKKMLLNARRLKFKGDEGEMILLAIESVPPA